MNDDKISKLTYQLLRINKAIYKAIDICYILEDKFVQRKRFDIFIELRGLSRALHRTTSIFYDTGCKYTRALYINDDNEQLTRVSNSIILIASKCEEVLQTIERLSDIAIDHCFAGVSIQVFRTVVYCRREIETLKTIHGSLTIPGDDSQVTPTGSQ